MKKKILSFIFILCLILSCAVVFFACNNKQTEKKTYTVTFVYGDGTDNLVTQVEEGDFATKPTNPSKTGYTFDGWYHGEDKWVFTLIPITQNFELVARWNINAYTISYELNGGTNSESNLSTYTVETNLTFAEPTKDGYKFMGWFIDNEFENEITNTNGRAENLTVFAKWSKINAITYELNESTNNPDNPTTFFEHEEVVLKAPTKDDEYKLFTGWFLDSHYENKIETIPAGTTEDIKLWARWENIFKIDKYEQHEKITELTSVGKTLTELKIPRSVTEIGNMAFAESDVLEKVSFNGNSKVMFGLGVFQNCSKLSSVSLPSGTRYIEAEVFKNCVSLISITIPSSVWEIKESAFEGCVNLETITFEDDSELEEIGELAFNGCSSLQSIVIPVNVESIGNYAFADCSALESVTFAEGCILTGISKNTFTGCVSLTSITIPNSIINVGEFAFNGCNKLASVIFETDSKLKTIYEGAFYSCSGLQTITIPKSVEEIKSEVFKGCAKLNDITFESDGKLTSIGSRAFSGCIGLETITIPKSVNELKGGVFNGCSELATVNFESGSELTCIASGIFSGCVSLTSITIPSSVEMIGNLMFDQYNYNIESVIFEDVSTWYATSREDWEGDKTEGTIIDVSNGEENVQYVKGTDYLYKK